MTEFASISSDRNVNDRVINAMASIINPSGPFTQARKIRGVENTLDPLTQGRFLTLDS